MPQSSSDLTITSLRFEHVRETLGIGVDRPRLSWTVKTAAQAWRQIAYEIECSEEDGRPTRQTGKVASDQSVLVAWTFEPLQSRERLAVRVRVWGKDGQVSEWSQPVSVEAGLLQPGDWTARFVTPAWVEDITHPNPAPYLRREFDLRPGIKSARLYVTALGLYELTLNGAVVGDHVLAPGWTSYDKRLRYQTFDLSGLLREGRNAIGAILADGWYRGRLGFGGGRRNGWGEHLALLAQLEIHYNDGSTERILTDEAWRAATGPILLAGIYEGETYDARLEFQGWSLPGFDDGQWTPIRPLEQDFSVLFAPVGPPVRRIESVAPQTVISTPSGKTILDFGQNLVGRLSLTVQGFAGQTITLRHAEVLENGELCVRPLRFAEATDRYTLRGGGIETWEPRFTFHGFRYVEVEGWPGQLNLNDFRAVVLHSDMERTGWFECSDPLLNRLHENVVWGMRGNFLDVPTDCPQRDERLGWTGDLEVFSPTASFLYDASGFLESWLADLAAEQKKSGGIVPPVVPNVMGRAFGAAAWADAATVVPWVLYQRFGDVGILEKQFESMAAWVDYIASVAGEQRLWDRGFQFGDWLDPTAPPDKPGQARTDKAIVATAYFAYSAGLVGKAAEVLGKEAEKKKYLALAAEVRNAFTREYVTPAGRMISDAETAYALAIAFQLLATPEQISHAGDRLAELVRDSGYHIRTGFVGTPLICDALCSTDHYLAAFRLLMQRECPSWLYPVTMGATTIWERWDSMLPDGSVNPGEMTSFNHYALGAVADWLHRTVGGLAPAEPGYRCLAIHPRPGGKLAHALTRHLTPYGMAECAWKIEAGKIELDVVIPPNTTALVTLPGGDGKPVEVGSGAYHWSSPYQDPDARGPFTVDDLIGEIMSDGGASKAVLESISHLPGAGMVRMILQTEHNFTMRELLESAPNASGLLPVIADTLAKLGSH